MWTKEVSIAKGITEEVADQMKGKVVTFGSYRLGVHAPNADIDTLCIAPKTCVREDFFSSLIDILKNEPDISDIHPLPYAFVPVLKFKYSGIYIDLLFVSLQLNTVSNDSFDILNESNLIGLDDPAVRIHML